MSIVRITLDQLNALLAGAFINTLVIAGSKGDLLDDFRDVAG